MTPLKVLTHPPYLIILHPFMQQSGIVMGTPLPQPGGAYTLENVKISETTVSQGSQISQRQLSDTWERYAGSSPPAFR